MNHTTDKPKFVLDGTQGAKTTARTLSADEFAKLLEPIAKPSSWCPTQALETLYRGDDARAPIVRQARVELLALIEFCAPPESKQRLAAVVGAICALADEAAARLAGLAK